VAHAAAGDTIQFAANLHGGTITLGSTLDIQQDLTLDGAGAGITVNGAGNRVFVIEPGVVADVNALTITGGGVPGSSLGGGGIWDQGSLTLSNSTVTGNSAAVGGAIYTDIGSTMTMSGDTVNNNTATTDGGGVVNAGELTIVNCTIAANVANQGGGIDNIGVLKLANSTVASNTVTGSGADGGGIVNAGFGSNLALLNTIVFNPNSGAATHNDVFGMIAQAQGDLFGSGANIASGGDLGSNQFNAQPLLGPLENNGGPTATMALLPGSPAIGAGAAVSLINGLVLPGVDQRGAPRPANSIDLGAFQTQTPSPKSPPPQPAPPPAAGTASPGLESGRLALDALLMADGLLTNNAFFVTWGMRDYARLRGALDSAGQAQAQALLYQDFFLDLLLLSGAA
jgi:hypothetical protein